MPSGPAGHYLACRYHGIAASLVHLHPMAHAAWVGVHVTALNLFPLGQLDGGHVAYAVLGRRARWVTIGTALGVVGLTLVSVSWIAWARLVVATIAKVGLSHPPTADDLRPLGGGRHLLAVAVLAVLTLCFTAVPVESSSGRAAPRGRGPPVVAATSC